MEKTEKTTELLCLLCHHCHWIMSFSFSSTLTISLLMVFAPLIALDIIFQLAFLTPSLYGRVSLLPLHLCHIPPWLIPLVLEFRQELALQSSLLSALATLQSLTLTAKAPPELINFYLAGPQSLALATTQALLVSWQVLLNTSTCCPHLLWAHQSFPKCPVI